MCKTDKSICVLVKERVEVSSRTIAHQGHARIEDYLVLGQAKDEESLSSFRSRDIELRVEAKDPSICVFQLRVTPYLT